MERNIRINCAYKSKLFQHGQHKHVIPNNSADPLIGHKLYLIETFLKGTNFIIVCKNKLIPISNIGQDFEMLGKLVRNWPISKVSRNLANFEDIGVLFFSNIFFIV